MMNKRLQGFFTGVLIGSVVTGGLVFAEPLQEAIDVVYDSYRIIIDGSDKSNTPDDSRPFVFNGRTYVPLRYIAESMGKQVQWDGETKSIYINDEGTLREDVYFYKLPYLETSGFFSFDKDNARVIYNAKGETQSITYALNGLADKVFCTLDGIAALDDTSMKVKFYNGDNDSLLYETGYITNASEPLKIEFSVKGVLKLKIEATGAGVPWNNSYSSFYLNDFRYSKLQ